MSSMASSSRSSCLSSPSKLNKKRHTAPPKNTKKKSTKKSMENNPKNKKQERENHYSVDLSCQCISNTNQLKATVLGAPLSYKRSGRKKSMSYDQQALEKKSFVNAVDTLFQINKKEMVPFQKQNVQVRATFYFTRKCIMNDVDNLTKFILDCFQIGKIYHDDRQVMKLVVEKKTGTRDMTVFHISRHFLEEEDNNDNQDNGNNNSKAVKQIEEEDTEGKANNTEDNVDVIDLTHN